MDPTEVSEWRVFQNLTGPDPTHDPCTLHLSLYQPLGLGTLNKS